MIFAAGRGTRMAPLTDDHPKPMVKVAGKPLIAHALDLVRGAGLDNVVANTHYLPDSLEDYLARKNVITIHEPVLLETGGGLRNALPVLGKGSVLTLNSDAVWRGANPIQQLLGKWNPDEMDALLCLIQPNLAAGHTGEGDFAMESDRRLTRAPGYIYSGLQITKTDRLARIKDTAFSLNVVWDQMLADNRLFGMVYDGAWCDVGRPESIPLAEAMLNV